MEDTIFTKPLRLLFGLVTMTVVNSVILTLIPSPGVGLVTILLLDMFLWWLADKEFYLYSASVSFFGALGGLIWVVYWDLIKLIDIFKGKFLIPPIKESLYMMAVGICAAGLFFLGLHYLHVYLKSKDK